MKKIRIIAFILAALTVLASFAGCFAGIKKGSKNDDTDGRPTGARVEADTAKLVQTLETAKAGEKFTLGSWEQDGNAKNGAEAIEWVILYQDVGKALVLSDRIIDFNCFKKAEKDVKFTRSLYRDSDLRIYLNDDFYNNAFTDKEKTVILKSKITTPYIEDYTVLSYETEDNVFPLSVDDVSRYVTRKGTLLYGVPSDYIADKYKSKISEVKGVEGVEKAMSWWLRDMGSSSSKNAAYVAGYDDKPSTYGWEVDYKIGIRPAMWIVYNESDMNGYANGTVQPKPDAELDARIASLKVGDKIEFGSYDANPYVLDGYETMTWTVLDSDDEGYLLFADNIYCQEQFDANDDGSAPKETYWEISDLRGKINSPEFINSFFNPKERSKLIKTHVATENNSMWDRECGNPTDDYLFVPSDKEIEKYFPDESTRGLSEVSYWLRSPDAFAPNIGSIVYNGSVYSSDPDGYSGIRFMMRIKK